jgi:hypothetical protein
MTEKKDKSILQLRKSKTFARYENTKLLTLTLTLSLAGERGRERRVG